ncbi:MAG: S8 family peptidase [Chitinophagaceae bacterium]
MLSRFLICLSMILPFCPKAQDIAEVYTCSPRILSSLTENDKKEVYWLATRQPDSLKSWLRNFSALITPLREISSAGILVIETDRKSLLSALRTAPSVYFIDKPRQPTEELSVKRTEVTVNGLSRAWTLFPGLRGSNQHVSIKEYAFDTLDVDLKGRILRTGLESATATTHATTMSSLIAGAGNSSYAARGVARQAKVSSSSFSTLLPDEDNCYQQANIEVQNHSYGTGLENYYGADAAAYDASVMATPHLLHVFSSGNSGNLTQDLGTYKGLTGWSNLTGSFKMAKNVLVVGSVDSFSNALPLSSCGPAYDGRIKPELVAYGVDGTSGAAALVSGTALLLHEAYQHQHPGTKAPASLLKALLINSATDLGTAGPDYKTGYGNLNAAKALEEIQTGQYLTGSLPPATQQEFPLKIPIGALGSKITLCWTDPPAAANTSKALVNDLDLEVIERSSGKKWTPWVLSVFPLADSLNTPATRGRDSVNNVEQISWEAPPGDYLIRISSRKQSSTQAYSVCWSFTRQQEVVWYAPMGVDPLTSGQHIYLRWQASADLNEGSLAYRFIGSNSWQVIQARQNLQTGYTQFKLPDTLAFLQFRLSIPNRDFLSDTVLVTPALQIKTGLYCEDSVLVYWNPIPPLNNYTVYTLGQRYLEPTREVSDTFCVLKRIENPTMLVAVAPSGIALSGSRLSGAIDPSVQGITCYFNYFLAEPKGNREAQLRFSLGSVYRIRKIYLEKLRLQSAEILQQFNPDHTGEYTYEDTRVFQGGNRYRIKLELEDGTVQYSTVEVVYGFDRSDYVLFPNPLTPLGGRITLAGKDLLEGQLLILDLQGRVVYQQVLSPGVTTYSLPALQKGLYAVQLIQPGKANYVQKLLVQ